MRDTGVVMSDAQLGRGGAQQICRHQFKNSMLDSPKWQIRWLELSGSGRTNGRMDVGLKM